jgi:hypothetical protein
MYNLSLFAVSSNRSSSGFAHFANSFEFWDSAGNVLPNVQYTLTGLEVPEPSTAWLAFLGISALAASIHFPRASIKSV